jgi:hypothetical protein
VDSEGVVAAGDGVWVHLKKRDGWSRPEGANDDHAHLMVQAMEAWFHADKTALSIYYNQGFREGALRRNPHVEEIAKTDLFARLEAATRDCQTGQYSKGRHSFEILARIDPAKVRAASPHAERFLSTLERLCTP